MRRRAGAPGRLLTAVIATMAIASLPGCTEVEEPAAHVHQPVHLEPIEGSEVQRVVFDQRGAEQVSVRTAPVRRRGKHTVVPYAALIYDGQGTSWVYTSPEPLTYVRVLVDVARIQGGRVLLHDGPSVDTAVVTTGASEVYGAELGIGGGH